MIMTADVRRLMSTGAKPTVRKKGETVKAERLAQSVAEQVRDGIIAAHMSPGDKLPPESALMAQYGVGRSTIREAMKRLQAENVVSIRHGRGSFVADNTGVASDPLGLTFEDRERLLPELMAVRLLLEPGIAELAAQERTQADLDAMAEANEAMAGAAHSGSDYDDYDYRFHKAMAESSHNSVLRRIYPVILEGIERGYEHTAHVHGSVDAALGFHRDILDAIRAGDAPKARRLTEMHIRQTMQDINGSTKGELT